MTDSVMFTVKAAR